MEVNAVMVENDMVRRASTQFVGGHQPVADVLASVIGGVLQLEATDATSEHCLVKLRGKERV